MKIPSSSSPSPSTAAGAPASVGSAPLDPTLERLARRRAGRKLGWTVHAAVYLIVNTVLALVAASRGGDWAVVPMLGWGLGLAIHGLVVFGAGRRVGLYERLLARERRALGAGDPW